jgi:hypothetical protein
MAGGEGAVNELPEFRCWWCAPWNGEGGANTEVGVGTGVFWLEDEAVTPGTTGFRRLGTSPVYAWPSSVGEKDRVEQKPSDDVISSVRPSLDLRIMSVVSRNGTSWTYHVRSVKVAQ